MDAKHTPGPWELRPDLPYSTQGWVVFSGRGENNRTICRLPYGHTIPAVETEASRTNTANADLIARAPILLADNARLRAALKYCAHPEAKLPNVQCLARAALKGAQ